MLYQTPPITEQLHTQLQLALSSFIAVHVLLDFVIARATVHDMFRPARGAWHLHQAVIVEVGFHAVAASDAWLQAIFTLTACCSPSTSCSVNICDACLPYLTAQSTGSSQYVTRKKLVSVWVSMLLYARLVDIPAQVQLSNWTA